MSVIPINNHRYIRTKKNVGFTLIELLVVLAILGLLAGLVGPRMMKHIGESKTKAARLQIAELSTSLDVLMLEIGRYPSTTENLRILVEKPDGVDSWRGPYLKKSTVPKDPWGNSYHYISPGEHGPYDLFSLGADNERGGIDENSDINSWD